MWNIFMSTRSVVCMNMVEVSVSKGFMRASLGLSVLYLSHV